MKDGWQDTTLGDEVDLLTGFPFESKKYITGEKGIRLVRGDNIVQGAFRWDDVKRWNVAESQNLSAYFLTAGDVVLAMDRPWIEAGLKFACVGEQDLPCLLVQRVARLRAKNNLDQKFLRYVIASREFTNHILGVQTGTAVPHISGGQIKSYRLHLPPLSIQRRIADILGALDDKIECNRRNNQTLEAMAQALYKHWFVDFGPFRGGEFVDSELGGIPQGWEVKPIGEVVETLGGGTPSTKEPEYWNNGDINWYVPSDLTAAKTLFISESSKKISQTGLKNSAAHLFPAYSVMMTSRATIGEIAINRTQACTNQGFITVIPNERISPYQIVFWLRHNMEKIQGMAHGTTFKEITRGTFRTFPIPIAKDAAPYIRQSKALFDQIESNIIETAMLTRTRDYLLPQLLSGKVEVKTV